MRVKRCHKYAKDLVIINDEMYVICYENNNEICGAYNDLDNAKNRLKELQETNPHISYILRKFKEVNE